MNVHKSEALTFVCTFVVYNKTHWTIREESLKIILDISDTS